MSHPEKPVALGVDSPPSNAAPSPSKVKPLNPNALVWSVEGRVTPPGPPQPIAASVIAPPPTHFTPFQPNKQLTPPAVALRPSSPSTVPAMAPVDVDPATIQLQQEFLIARNVVQLTPRPALTAVLLSLLDDYPHLAPIIRYRCERGTAVISGGVPPHLGTPQQWTASETAGSTPPSQQRRRAAARNRDEEQQEICGTHNSLRSLKHLQFNPMSGHYECIPGFHCLVEHSNSRDVSAAPSNTVTPKKEDRQREAEKPEIVDVARLQNLLDSVRLAHPEQR